MANPETFSTRPNIRARIVVNVGAQNVSANTTSVRVRLICEETAEQPSYDLDGGNAFSLSGFGNTITGTWGFDFRPTGNQSYTIIDTTRNITHNSDGTQTLTITTDVNGGVLGSSSPNETVVLPRIPRGPRVKDGGVWKNTVLYVKDAGVWKVAIPYVKDAGTWKIGGG
jgi:hypothetical protein